MSKITAQNASPARRIATIQAPEDFSIQIMVQRYPFAAKRRALGVSPQYVVNDEMVMCSGYCSGEYRLASVIDEVDQHN